MHSYRMLITMFQAFYRSAFLVFFTSTGQCPTLFLCSPTGEHIAAALSVHHVPSFLSVLHNFVQSITQNYKRYQHETSLVDWTRWGEVQCTRTINSLLHNLGVLALCYFSYLYFVWSITQNYKRYQHETSLVARTRWGEVQCTRTINSLLHNLGVLALCYFSYLYFVWSITPKL